jgi:hypothetical protein
MVAHLGPLIAYKLISTGKKQMSILHLKKFPLFFAIYIHVLKNELFNDV